MNLEYVDEFIHNLIVVSAGVLGSLFLISIYAVCYSILLWRSLCYPSLLYISSIS